MVFDLIARCVLADYLVLLQPEGRGPLACRIADFPYPVMNSAEGAGK
jgi:hypothetical protein